MIDATASLPRRPFVLVVEDDRLVRTTMVEVLRAHRFIVTAVATVKEARSLLTSQQPDLAVVDMLLPDGRGTEVAEALAGPPRIPVVFLTAYHDEQLTQQAIQSGAAAYLIKPVPPARLIPTIQALLERSAEHGKVHLVNTQLNEALSQGREVNVAVGLLMERYRIGREEAIERLRAQARSQRVKLSDLAQRLIESAEGLRLDAVHAGHRESAESDKAEAAKPPSR